jgi:hypothetical protein
MYVPLPENSPDIELTREQNLEIERRLSDPELFASDREVRAAVTRLTK